MARGVEQAAWVILYEFCVGCLADACASMDLVLIYTRPLTATRALIPVADRTWIIIEKNNMGESLCLAHAELLARQRE